VQVLALVAALVATGPQPVVQPAVVAPGDPVIVQVSGATASRALRVYLVDLVGRRTAVGRVRPDRHGRAQLRFRLPSLEADVYAPAVVDGSGRLAVGRGRLSVQPLPPAGFGPLGAAGCTPASPANDRMEVFGSAAGAQLWALGAAQPGSASAALDGVVGKETKIIFRMTLGGAPDVFYAVAPDGSNVPPIWMQRHSGSTWTRPGSEWGAGFVFSQPGCWRIHAGTPPAQGDVWLSIRS
jgi:hypothetical protein